ncbi:MAG: hydrogenase nickel incorporation protein HypB [Clostridiales bacterium]|nr:hydrogenase nickel incorporation protein HypB [Clostridiales bacterium]MCF8021808.1 hydrogenase nickel incorporation protein HypB [Clostridiales bacterium]
MEKDLLRANTDQAEQNRELFNKNNVSVINMISSPGSGKTTLLEKSADSLRDYNIGVVVGDLYTARDAERIEKAGLHAVQVNTEGMCHLNSSMVARAVKELPLEQLDLLFIENVGNLVCPVNFDLGEHTRVAVLSITEGIDKPSKYPGIFRDAGTTVINKIDLLPHLDFDLDTCINEIKQINTGTNIFVTSTTTKEGLDEWCSWLKSITKGNGQEA